MALLKMTFCDQIEGSSSYSSIDRDHFHAVLVFSNLLSVTLISANRGVDSKRFCAKAASAL